MLLAPLMAIFQTIKNIIMILSWILKINYLPSIGPSFLGYPI